jgi:DNA-binding NtrC family response regulator
VILADSGEVTPAELDAFEEVPLAPGDRGLPDGWTLLDVGREAQRKAESEAILRMLKDTAGNKTEAARRLGVSYKTLWSKLKEYELS